MKRVLAVAYHFLRGTSMGDVRVRRALKNLHRHGYRPVVITHHPDAEGGMASTEGWDTFPVRGLDLASLYRRMRRRPPRESADAKGGAPVTRPLSAMETGFSTWVKQWLMVPDPQMVWRRAALQAAREVIRSVRPDVVFASLAPRTDLMVAARAAAEFNLPCVAEYRDLWTANFYDNLKTPTRLHDRLHRRMERAALRRVTRLTCVSTGLAEYLQAEYPALRGRVSVDYGFFDPSEYPPKPARPAGAPFVISYVGKFYYGRRPGIFLEGMRRFVERSRLRPDQFRFRWLGEIIGADPGQDLARGTELSPFIDYYGHVPHRRAMEALVESDAALIVQAPNDTIHIPGKMYEALGARTPILYISPPFEGTEVLDRTGGGIHCPHDPDAVAGALARIRERAERNLPWPYNEEAVQSFDRDVFLKRLAGLLDVAIEDHVAPSA